LKAVARQPAGKEVQTKPTYNSAASVGWATAFAPAHSPIHPMVQRTPVCPCDGGCPRCAPALQTKLTISQPQDRYEQEADRVADRVMRMPEPEIQPKPT
jgi:hypothetical protein